MKIVLIVIGAVTFIIAVFNLIKYYTEYYKDYKNKRNQFSETLENKIPNSKELKRLCEKEPTEENKTFYEYYLKWKKTSLIYVPLSLVLFVVAIVLFIVAERMI